MTEYVRKSVLKRDGECCVCCGNNDDIVIDKIVDTQFLGCDMPQNLAILCGECHKIQNGGKFDYDIDVGDVNRATVQYISEFYEKHGYFWTPTWGKLVPIHEEKRDLSFELLHYCFNDEIL